MNEEDTLVGLYSEKKGYGRIRNYAQGEVIIKPGDAVDALLMVLSGTVISLRTRNGRTSIRHHTASTINGEEMAAFIGVSAFIMRTPSPRSYRAGSDCMIISLSASRLLDLYNDGHALLLMRDMIRNADPEVVQGLLRSLRKAFGKMPAPGMDPDAIADIFRIPDGVSSEEARRLDGLYCTFASKLLYAILDTHRRTSGSGEPTLVQAPIHRTSPRAMPPPTPGSGRARTAWEVARKRA